jgi:hypothetical protein
MKVMFGIWNGMEKRFVFGIREKTAEKAEQAFFRKAGKTAYKWRFEVRVIPEGWINPKNPHYVKKGESIMSSIFEKYASKINQEELAASQQEIQENASNGGQREEVPVGKYEVKVDKLECKKSKAGNLMVSIWFRILSGKFEKSVIFYNGVFHEDWMRHRVAKILSDLLDDGDRQAEINLILKSGNLDEINNFCMDIHESVEGRLEYLLDYGQNKGYQTYTIAEVYEV